MEDKVDKRKIKYLVGTLSVKQKYCLKDLNFYYETEGVGIKWGTWW